MNKKTAEQRRAKRTQKKKVQDKIKRREAAIAATARVNRPTTKKEAMRAAITTVMTLMASVT